MGPMGVNYNLPCESLLLVHRLEWRHSDGTFISGVYSDTFFGEYLTATLNFGLLNDTVHRGVYECKGLGVFSLFGVTVTSMFEESNTVLVNGMVRS